MTRSLRRSIADGEFTVAALVRARFGCEGGDSCESTRGVTQAGSAGIAQEISSSSIVDAAQRQELQIATLGVSDHHGVIDRLA